MRMISYIFLAYFALALQIGLAPFIAYHGAAPNLVLLAVVFIAVHAPRDAALIGCFALGFLQDLTTLQQPGLFALSYGLVALFVVSTQQVVYKEHPLTHFSLALAAGLITAIILLLHGWIHPPAARTTEGTVVFPAVRISTTLQLYSVLYTSFLAPIVLGLLQRARGLFGFAGRRRARAW
jgi:rod shape-determining protein MreD